MSKMKLKDLLDLIEFDTKIMIIDYYDPKSFKHKKIFHDEYNENLELKSYYDYKVINISLNELRGIIIIAITEDIKC